MRGYALKKAGIPNRLLIARTSGFGYFFAAAR